MKKEKLTIPKNFNQRVIELELEMETGIHEKKLLSELLSLYKLGHQYYKNEKKNVLSEYYNTRYEKLLIIVEKSSKNQESERNENHETLPTEVNRFQHENRKLTVPVQKQYSVSPVKTINNNNPNFDQNFMIATERNGIMKKGTSLMTETESKVFHTSPIEEAQNGNKPMRNYQIKFNPPSERFRNSISNKFNTKGSFIVPSRNNYSYFQEKSNTNVSLGNKSVEHHEVILEKTSKKEFKSFETLFLQDEVQDKIKALSSNYHKLQMIIESELESQKEKFEVKKKFYQDEAKTKVKKKKYLTRNQNYENLNENNEEFNPSLNYYDEKLFEKESPLHNEIENYIKNSYFELEKSIKQLKINFENDISQFNNDQIYKAIICKLKEDLDEEIKKLKIESARIRKENIEKIKEKYNAHF